MLPTVGFALEIVVDRILEKNGVPNAPNCMTPLRGPIENCWPGHGLAARDRIVDTLDPPPGLFPAIVHAFPLKAIALQRTVELPSGIGYFAQLLRLDEYAIILDPFDSRPHVTHVLAAYKMSLRTTVAPDIKPGTEGDVQFEPESVL
jgi:hypothetical protein